MVVLLAFSSALNAAEPRLVAGPLFGPAGMRSASLWLQADAAAEVQVEYGLEGRSEPSGRASTVLREEEDFAARIELVALEPGQTYRYRVLGRGTAWASGMFKTLPLWQWRGNPPNFRVLLGSCVYLNEAAFDRPGKPFGGGYSIFSHMAALEPQLTLWLGDNIYFREADYHSPWGMRERYRRDRALPELQALLRTGQHAAIWDDHDYGPNNAGASFVYKGESLKLFRRYWPNPTYGLPDTPGIFTVVKQGDVDFFLLDNRWYRDLDRLKIQGNKQMFGAAQMRWLKNALLESTATFKLIAAGSQLLNDSNRFEGWLNFREERADFLDWLRQQGVRGVFFLSGDRHFTELLRQDRGDSYPLHELTCSPLTSAAYANVDESENQQLVSGTLVRERNFCSLEFRGALGAREMLVGSYDGQGKELWQRKFSEAELGHRAK